MRVLYVNHTATVSGSERSMLVLLAGLTGGVEPRVATPPGPLADAVAELGIGVMPIRSTAGSLRLHPRHTPVALAEMALAARQVRRAAREHGAQIVHANSIRAGIELGLARLAPAATVVSVRDCLPAGAVTSAAMRLIAATASAVVANSRYTAECVRASAPGAPLEVVHPAIDAARFDPARIDRERARAELGVVGERDVLLGHVAQLSPWKGQETAIGALRVLHEQGIDAHLLLIGSVKFADLATRFDNEAYVARLHRLVADSGVQERVSFLGERDDVPRLIRALDVLLLPSHGEPFGRALLEAMSLAVPVVATSDGGSRELVRDGVDGYLAPPSEPAAWAEAVRRIIERPDRGRELGRSGRERIVQSFGVAEHVRATLAVYERALARRGAARAA